MKPAGLLMLPWLLLILLGAAPPAGAQSVWEFSPYRIQVFLALGTAPELTPQLESDLAEELAGRCSAVIGAAWDVTVTAAPAPLRRAMAADLEAVAVETLPKKSLESDKVLLVAVTRQPAGYRVVARELDVHTLTWNAAVSVPAWQAAKLSDNVFRAVRHAFAPLAVIGTVQKKEVTLRLRAAALPVRDASLALVKPGSVFQPMFRYNDRDGKPRRITTIPFTFLSVQKVTPTDVRCVLQTGVRSPLSGRRRGRVEQLALGVVPPRKPTCLILQSRNDPKQVLGGYDVYLSSEGTATAKWLGRTDWRGRLTIQPMVKPLEVLLIKCGGEMLARLPIVPGLHAELAAPVPNNDQKLRAEGFLKGFQENLIDTVTRREVLIAQTKGHLKARRLDEADKVLGQLRAMRTRDELTRALDQEAKKVISPDPGMQRKIDKQFDETRQFLVQYLDPTAVEKLAESVRESRGAKPATGKR